MNQMGEVSKSNRRNAYRNRHKELAINKWKHMKLFCLWHNHTEC